MTLESARWAWCNLYFHDCLVGLGLGFGLAWGARDADVELYAGSFGWQKRAAGSDAWWLRSCSVAHAHALPCPFVPRSTT